MTRISISHRSRSFINTLRLRQGGNFTSSSWGLIRKSVKNEVSKKLFANQGFKCVYCERYLIGHEPEIDHFAHKGEYPQFTFIPINLFYTCSFCNSSGRKGQQNTINVLMENYNQCTFSIVHPFYNVPNNEIVFTDAERIYLDLPNCTPLGIATINFFKWDDYHYSHIRAIILTNERLKPLTSVDEMQLIQKAISYKI
ncbi:MAG: hypothetical protein WAU21_11790 [Chitinophagales bacterium]|nr:hypothetical protein [Bacteroidota bacterium]MBK8681890.1 hypothetical protein [Bacteroidota bacterium]